MQPSTGSQIAAEQNKPSGLQNAWSGVLEQTPVTGWDTSTVHATLSLQSMGVCKQKSLSQAPPVPGQSLRSTHSSSMFVPPLQVFTQVSMVFPSPSLQLAADEHSTHRSLVSWQMLAAPVQVPGAPHWALV